jgi:acetyl esterase/lipase
MRRVFCIVFGLALLAMAVETVRRQWKAWASAITSESDVEYGTVAERPLLLDVVRPARKAERLRPAIVFVHGGGWIAGDKSEMRPLAETAARAGFVCFNINYRLSFGAENTWPIPLDDTQRAVRWIRANAARYGVDPARIGAMGTSAGGHLVTFLGTSETLDNSDPALAQYSSRVQCVVDLFGPSDFTDPKMGDVPAALMANDLLRQFLGGTPAEMAAAARAASPLWRVDEKSAPFLIFHGRNDALVSPAQSERLHAALQQAGVESRLVILEGEGHMWKRPDSHERCAAEAVAFFQRHLKP